MSPPPAIGGNGERDVGKFVLTLGLLAGALSGSVGIVSYFTRPLETQIEMLRKDNDRLRLELERHTATESHLGTAARLAEIAKQFAEVETQFREKERRADEWTQYLKQRVHDLELWRLNNSVESRPK